MHFVGSPYWLQSPWDRWWPQRVRTSIVLSHLRNPAWLQWFWGGRFYSSCFHPHLFSHVPQLEKKKKKGCKAREIAANPSRGILNVAMLWHDISVQNLYMNKIKNILGGKATYLSEKRNISYKILWKITDRSKIDVLSLLSREITEGMQIEHENDTFSLDSKALSIIASAMCLQ